MAGDINREVLADELENLRKEREAAVAKEVDQVAARAQEAREKLAEELAYAAGAEAARIDGRLDHLDASVERINGNIKSTGIALDQLKDSMNNRFQEQISASDSLKRESRKLLLQIFATIMVALIGGSATIIVALISSGSP